MEQNPRWMFYQETHSVTRLTFLETTWEAWKNIVEYVVILPLRNCFEVLQSNLWWNHEIQGIGYGFFKCRAT
jgi:hypothetical protein